MHTWWMTGQYFPSDCACDYFIYRWLALWCVHRVLCFRCIRRTPGRMSAFLEIRTPKHHNHEHKSYCIPSWVNKSCSSIRQALQVHMLLFSFDKSLFYISTSVRKLSMLRSIHFHNSFKSYWWRCAQRVAAFQRLNGVRCLIGANGGVTVYKQ